MNNNDNNSGSVASVLALLIKEMSIGAIVIFGVIFAIIVLLIIAPVGVHQYTKDELIDNNKEITDIIRPYYDKAKDSNEVRNTIVSFINERFDDNGTYKDLIMNGGVYSYTTETSDFKIRFMNTADDMGNYVAAYTNAINNTLVFTSLSDKLEPKDENNEDIDYEEETYVEFDEDNSGGFNYAGFVLDSIFGKHDYFKDVKSRGFYNSIKEQASNFFIVDLDSEDWILRNVYTTTKIIKHEDGGDKEIVVAKSNIPHGVQLPPIEDDPVEPEPSEDEIIVITHGTIIIPMYYDLSSYQADKIQKTAQNLAETSGQSEFEVMASLYTITENYYDSYITEYCGHYDTWGRYIEGKDNREEIFSSLINKGKLFYVPISGMGSIFIAGELGYIGDTNITLTGTPREIWGIIESLRKQGILATNTYSYNCTAFAQFMMWLQYKEVYEDAGFLLSGNGAQMATNLVKDHPDRFYLGSTPAPGGIYSISSPSGANHVGFISAVSDTGITICEGNYGNPATRGTKDAGIRINVYMSWKDFNTYVNGIAKSMTGTTAGVTVYYANPIVINDE